MTTKPADLHLKEVYIQPAVWLSGQRNIDYDVSDVTTACNQAGARLAFGGRELEGHTIPEVYGAVEPTAVVVPLRQILASDANWELATTELFGPFQVTRLRGWRTPRRCLLGSLVTDQVLRCPPQW